MEIKNFTIDACSQLNYGVVLRAYFSKIENCDIYGAIDTDLLITGDAKDGTPLGTNNSMVNNRIINCWRVMRNLHPNFIVI